jgi:hypothetical protein
LINGGSEEEMIQRQSASLDLWGGVVLVSFRTRRLTLSSSELFKLADEEKKRFSDALAEWESKVKPEHKTKVDISQTHTWKEVLQAVDDAKQSYDDPEGRLGWLRGRLRKIGDKAGSAAPLLDGWLGLLPSGSEYGSVICGGIKLIVGVWKSSPISTSHQTLMLVRLPPT